LSETLKCWIFGISENTKQNHATKSIKNHNTGQKLNLLDRKQFCPFRVLFSEPKNRATKKKTGTSFFTFPSFSPSEKSKNRNAEPNQAAANVPKLLGFYHSVYYSISSISPRIPSRPRPWRSGKKTEIMLLKRRDKKNIYIPGSSIFVCKTCAEIHPQKPTTRQNIYISGRSRYKEWKCPKMMGLWLENCFIYSFSSLLNDHFRYLKCLGRGRRMVKSLTWAM